jgi:hypothetical protein
LPQARGVRRSVVTDLKCIPPRRTPRFSASTSSGNLAANLRRDPGTGFVIRAGGVEVRRILSSYSEALPGESSQSTEVQG